MILSDSSEESVGTSTARVILLGTILSTIPSTAPTTDLPIIHGDTLLIPTDTPTTSPIVPTIPPIAPTIQYTSLFICTDSSDSDTLDTPPSQDLYEVTVARWRSRVAARSSPPSSPIYQILPAPPRFPHRLAVLVSPGQSILVGRSYHDASRDSQLDSWSETSSDSYSDTSSYSSLRHSSSGYAISDSPYDLPTAISVKPSSKRCRSLSVPISSLLCGALSLVHVDLLPPPNRIRNYDSVTDLEVSSEEGYVPYVPREADIDECITYADAIRAGGTDDRDVVETTAEEEAESSARGMIEVEVDPRVRPVVDDDMCESVREDVPYHVITDEAVKVTYETLRDLVQRFHDHTVEIQVYWIQDIKKQDNARLKGTLDVESQRVDRLHHSINILTATRTGMTQDAINELNAERVEKALKAYDAARNPEPEPEMEIEQQDNNIEANANNGNSNRNGNGNPNVNNRGVVPVARESTYQDFMKCQPLNFKGTEGHPQNHNASEYHLGCYFIVHTHKL
ncbi:hypothetical protein Tco_1130994 [Tanacetum coccineum]